MTFQLTLAALVLAIWILSRLAARYPHVGWLQPFENAFPKRPGRRRPATHRADMAGTTAGAIPHLRGSPMPLNAFERTADRLLERQARSRGVVTGLQLILMGVAIPPAFAILKMMLLWSETTRTEWWVVGAASALCITCGIAAIWQNRRA